MSQESRSQDVEDAKRNTDREIWRAKPGDYYSPSIHVTEAGNIGINVGGHVLIMPVEAWHRLACVDPPSMTKLAAAVAERDAMAEALRPFAEVVEEIVTCVDDNVTTRVVVQSSKHPDIYARVTVGAFRHAAALLAARASAGKGESQ